MGIYPVTGQPIYLISSPFFPQMEVQIGSSNDKLTVVAHNLSSTSFYVQRVVLVDRNGSEKAINRSWVTHEEVVATDRLEFFLGEEPLAWDKGGEKPPSLSTGGY